MGCSTLNKPTIKKSTFYTRLYRGWTYEEASQIPVERKTKALKVPLYLYNGMLMSVKQIAEKYNINYKTLHKRLERGWNIEEAVETPIHRKGVKMKNENK